MCELILASNSPRRKALLADMGYSFIVEPSQFEEVSGGLSARDTALFFAYGKAADVFSRHPDALVLGADTVVALDGEIFGKPKDDAAAAAMLRRLSGRTHTVYTGVALLGPAFEERCVVGTEVTFAPLTEQTIQDYVASGLPRGKAGAYGIQDGWPLVEKIEGSYTNVVGLPTERVGIMLRAACGGKQC